MTRQVKNQQGRIINPLHSILFISAMLVFIFTVVYRMAKSESFSTAVAALVGLKSPPGLLSGAAHHRNTAMRFLVVEGNTREGCLD